MALPVTPVILLGAAVVTGVTGLVNLLSGAGKMREAERVAADAQERYEASLDVTEQAADATNARVASYGAVQDDARQRIVDRMVIFIRAHARQVSESAVPLLGGVESEIEEIAGFAGIEGPAIAWASSAAQATITGAAAYAGVPSAVAAFGTASTGAAISGLSGAAAESATLAWLGGGSLASGGGGVALGATALNAIAIGPALLVAGLVLNSKGERALTDAQRYATDVEIAIAKQNAFGSALSLVDERVEELTRILDELVPRGEKALGDLDAVEFDPNVHSDLFSAAMRYAVAIRDIVGSPIVLDGELNTQSERLVMTYREMT